MKTIRINKTINKNQRNKPAHILSCGKILKLNIYVLPLNLFAISFYVKTRFVFQILVLS